MKKLFYFVFCVAVCFSLTACAGNSKKQDDNYNRKKIYLTEEDYLEDLDKQAYAERREAKPASESNYIFEVQPETQKNVYFFDDRTQPMVPGEPSERDYKNTKRLWERPRRYSPEQYYAGAAAAPAADTGSENSSSYDSYSDSEFDY
ncbi:MAG: hypothetical protein IKL48_00385 [Elusimicrobiaceae bacterium]|nr:hypothetical protein [Elusimicrobiaceae bacterium]